MRLGDFLRNKIRNFLHIEPAANHQIVLQQRLDFYGNIARNKLWYRGDSWELSDFYSQLDVSPTLFWKASSTKGMEIHKLHTGIPKLIIKTIGNIILHDYNGLEITEPTAAEQWEKIAEDNKFKKLLKRFLKKILIVGDGAFKVSFDRTLSGDVPIIEYVSGENVEFVRSRGRITEVVFLTTYTHNNRKYTFKERYGYGYILYELYNDNDEPIPTGFIPQTKWVEGQGVGFDKSVMLAVPVIYGESESYEGRGESLYEGKSDAFDALDEAWSQWMDALRAGRTKEYIPENLIPRDPDNGKLLKPNSFDNRFIEVAQDMSENSNSKITTGQAQIQHESYLSTYITALDLALQGIISPSTLGIDVKKLDNADAQREKEKATLYTRGNIIELLSDVLPELVIAAVCAGQIWHRQHVEKPTVKVNFGEYANPSFESQVETVSKGKTGGIMSTEAAVDELYGDSKDDEWKEKEVRRIKEEQGIVTMGDPPAVNIDGDA